MSTKAQLEQKLAESEARNKELVDNQPKPTVVPNKPIVQGVVRQPASGFVNVHETGGNIKVVLPEKYLEHLLSQCVQGHVGAIMRFNNAGQARVIYPENLSSFEDAKNDPKNQINLVPCNNQLNKIIEWNTTNKVGFLEEAHA